jgi:DNA-directed RNA polymerase subunit L
MNVDEEFWEYIYVLPSTLTKNSKVQMMQYKIIHHILAVNSKLKIWGKSVSDLCKTCKEIENIEHLIYYCPKALDLWNSIQIWWKAIFHFSITISALEIIFGLPNENNDNNIFLYNYVILYTKYYIYISKKKDDELHLYNLLLLIKKELTLKKNFYAEKNQLHKFNRIWDELYNNV